MFRSPGSSDGIDSMSTLLPENRQDDVVRLGSPWNRMIVRRIIADAHMMQSRVVADAISAFARSAARAVRRWAAKNAHPGSGVSPVANAGVRRPVDGEIPAEYRPSAAIEQIPHPNHRVRRQVTRRNLTQTPVVRPFRPGPSEPLAPAPNRPRALP